ncbi:hypothetical protein ACLHDG_14370 [Sulfurovum sp. CS9]|uniref:hypothetical protein n=1 Tax=Sulfurovum sp. CS9 TaxID=3391146 RepID=UPI0039EA1639
MNILHELEEFINEFNQDNKEDFSIDSIRVEFSKQHKQEELKELGKWSKIKKNSPLISKLKKRLTDNEITSVWRLENHNIYYYNMQDTPKYRRATLVIFGMKQYHKKAPPRELVFKVLSVLKNVSNIDICLDLSYKPNLKALSKYFTLTPYITKDGVITDTSYINDTGIPMIDKITIYNKGFKNKLDCILWRIEAMISIPNFKALALPLHEFKEIIDIARTTHD